MALDLSKYQDMMAEQGPDLNEASSGGGLPLPEPGVARMRFVSYIEMGKETRTIQGQTKTTDRVALVFELSGPKYPVQEIDGEKVPFRITIYENAGRDYGALSEKANLFKLFKKMNYDGTAKHFAQLLGKEYLGTIAHTTGKDKNTYATLRDESGYTVRGPFLDQIDEESGDVVKKRIKVEPAISPIRLFLWNFADLEMWHSLFIKEDRNPLQDRLRQAENYPGSPLQLALAEAGLPSDPLKKESKAKQGGDTPPEEGGDTPAAPANKGGKSDDDLLNGVA